MGFYVRKGFNFGPLRVNFSKSGIGLSLGVKGLRFSAGPNGSYVHAGRKGVYYKQKLPEIDESKNMLQYNIKLCIIYIMRQIYVCQVVCSLLLFLSFQLVMRFVKS